MIHVAVIVAAVLWFTLNGLLWYAKPPPLQWLLGSVVLGVIFFAGFFWYLQAVDADRAAVMNRNN
jgi:hypothetical protein